MSQNTPPNQTDRDESGSESNSYSTRYTSSTPDLDANAPQLQSADGRRISRPALLGLSATTIVVVVLAAWGIQSFEGRKDPAAKQREEAISIPDAPKVAPPAIRDTPLTPTPPIPLSTRGVRTIDSNALMPTAPLAPPAPSLMERRMMSGDVNGVSGNKRVTAPQPMQSDPEAAEATSAQPLNHPDALMLRGTYIRCVLETRIITDIPGFTSCVVTEPVYSFNGRKLLLPKGSKVLGKYDTEPTTARVAVIWDRIVTPTGIDVNMASPGVDNLGGAGHPGHFSAHWGSRIGAALLISMLSDAFKYEAAEHGPSNTTISNGVVTQTPFESNTAQSLQNLANQAVQHAANRPPTVTINQGTVLNIYVAKDVDFSGVVARF